MHKTEKKSLKFRHRRINASAEARRKTAKRRDHEVIESSGPCNAVCSFIIGIRFKPEFPRCGDRATESAIARIAFDRSVHREKIVQRTV